MDIAGIAALLTPFLPARLTDAQLSDLATYLELLLRWNARLNLTAVRDPEHIVTRHIGESLFTAAHLFGPASTALLRDFHAVDVGSGAGFPGLPLKIYAPQLRLTLIESRQKKATFLKEVIRALHLTEATVFAERAENYLAHPSWLAPNLVTLRAVEHFDAVLPIAASLLRGPERAPLDEAVISSSDQRRLALLIGAAQVERAHQLLPDFHWESPVAIPQSQARVLLVGSRSRP